MKNEEIPDRLWELKNEVVRVIENNAMSNDFHYQYKDNWEWIGRKMMECGKEIAELAKQYVQHKED